MRNSFLDVDIDTKQVDEWVVYAGYHARDARDPLRDAIHNVVVRAAREQILSQGVRSGNPYQQLAAEYELEKIAAVGFAEPILIRSGQMMRDLDKHTAVRVFRDHAWYRPENDYLHWHQTGGYIEGRPPRRVVLDLIPEDYREIQNIFESWLAELRYLNRRRSGDAPMPAFSIQDFFQIA